MCTVKTMQNPNQILLINAQYPFFQTDGQIDDMAARPRIIHAGGITAPHKHASFDGGASQQSAVNTAVSSVSFTSKSGYRCRKVRVKHEESQRKLHDQLAVLCGARYRNSNDRGVKRGGRVLTRPSLVKEGLVDTWQHSVDISGHDVKDIMVLVNEGTLSVRNVNGVTIATINLGGKSSVKDKLVCVVQDDNLIIKEVLLQGFSHGNITQQGEINIPLFHRDDDLSLWQAVFHIPGTFDKQNLHLRTYDEKLIIGWNPLVSSLGDIREVIMDIPHDVKTRTVNAVVSEHDQLVIEGVIGHGRERSFTM